jgi:hypothetical protein
MEYNMSAVLDRVTTTPDVDQEFAKRSNPRDIPVLTQQQQRPPHTAAQFLQQQQQQRQM